MSKQQPQTESWDQPVAVTELILVQPGAVVSRTLLNRSGGMVTAFAFDAGEELSVHTTPCEALVQGLEGDADISIVGRPHRIGPGQLLRLPAGQPHAVKAITPFKMLLVMIRAIEHA